MANNQENEDFSQDVKDEQHLNGEEAAGENGTENGNDQNGQNQIEESTENGGQANEAAGRDDDRLVQTFHLHFFD